MPYFSCRNCGFTVSSTNLQSSAGDCPRCTESTRLAADARGLTADNAELRRTLDQRLQKPRLAPRLHRLGPGLSVRRA